MKVPSLAAAALAVVALAAPTMAQITVLDGPQDRAAPSDADAGEAPASSCGTQPISIARMDWPSATLLAEIHARILSAEFGCQVQTTPGEPSATASSMGSTGQPAVAPELWVNRIPSVWNGAMETQMVRSAAPTYEENVFEGWYMPSTLAAAFPGGAEAGALAEVLSGLGGEEPIRFVSCPADWACSVINRNLVAAHGLAELVEIVEPANRYEMDQLIAEGLNRRAPFLFYYWQPNAVLAQLDFMPIDMGEYDAAAAQCLASRSCADPQPSSFPPDLVVIAVAEQLFMDRPMIAAYFQRATMPLGEMDALLAELNVPGATPEVVAEQFVAERGAIWSAWVGERP